MCTTSAVTPFDGKYLTSYLMAIVMFAQFLAICEIFTKLINAKRLTLKMKVKIKKEKNWTCANQLKMFDPIYVIFFTIVAAWEHMFRQT